MQGGGRKGAAVQGWGLDCPPPCLASPRFPGASDAPRRERCSQALSHALDGCRAQIDNVALLDLLCCFSAFASQSPAELVRPQVAEGGPLAIVQVRAAVQC